MQHSSYPLGKTSQLAGDEAIFYVTRNDGVINPDQTLYRVLDINPTQLTDITYPALFDLLVKTASDSFTTRRDLELALQYLDEQPTVYIAKRAHARKHLRIAFFPVADADNPQAVWGAVVSNVTNVWQNITRSFDHVTGVLSQLQTLISGTTGVTNTLLTKAEFWEPENQRPYLEMIDETVRTMEQLIETEQQMLRLQLRPSNLVPRSLDVKFEVERAIISTESQSAGRTITAHFVGNLPILHADSRRFNQVLHYALNHALSHTSANQAPELNVTAQPDTVLFSLEEHQPRVTIEEVQRALDLRSRINTDSSWTYSSETLPLHISSEIVYAHGGRMWAEETETNSIKLSWEFPITSLIDEVAPKIKEQHLDSNHVFAARILVGEDDASTARMIQNMLQREGYQVFHAINGSQVIDMAMSKYPDIILLDFYFPDITGIELCAQLREFSTVPIVMVTANGRTETMSEAFQIGVDDYITKPFHREELLARVSAQLRRASMNQPEEDAEVLDFGKLKIYPRLKQVLVADKLIKLSSREYKILELLGKNAGSVVTHEQILRRIWGPSYVGEPQYLWVYVSRLRRKIENDPADPQLIITEPGIGYFLAKDSVKPQT